MEKKQDKKKEPERFIRFDWAAKRLLRYKANFGVLEGLLTVLLGDGEHPVRIVEILESESNQLHMKDKFNRVDIKARNAEGEIILVEIQSNWELYFIERLLFGVAKAITEHIDLGESYGKVKKVYSICILYFSLGQGADYLYHGQTTFVGCIRATSCASVKRKRKRWCRACPRRFSRNTTSSAWTSSTRWRLRRWRSG
jgi:hypothetical protein